MNNIFYLCPLCFLYFDLIFKSFLLRESGCPLVVDFGSAECRMGWAGQEKPGLAFRLDSEVGIYKKKDFFKDKRKKHTTLK